MHRVVVLARREYLTRTRSKGFWIGILLIPVAILGIIAVANLMEGRSASVHRLVLVDATGKMAPLLEQALSRESDSGRGGTVFKLQTEAPAPDPRAQRADLNRRALAGDIDAWIWADADELARNEVEYHAQSVSNFSTQRTLRRALTSVVTRLRLRDAGYDYDTIEKLSHPIELTTVRITETGGRKEEGEGALVLSYVLFMFLYIVIVFFGQQVMTGVLEEKSTRVVELIVSKVTPFEFMMGKLSGIGLVGLTQLAVWVGVLAVLSVPSIQSVIMPPDFRLPPIPPPVLAHYLILFVLGFFVFASYYAAIGAAFNSTEEAQQLAIVAVFFLVSPMVLFGTIVNDPNSTLATVVSLVPVFTPLIMALRIAVRMPPLWQILLSYLLTGSFVVFMVWACSRIYRIGILMYGKKPTLRELVRWARYA